MSERKEWSHAPEGAIEVSPLWGGPLRPLAVLKWYVDGLLEITSHTGFEGLWLRNKKRVNCGTFHH